MIGIFDPLRHMSVESIALRFVMALVFGGLIGLERGRRQQAAGLRTHMMVCIGAASTMMVGEYAVFYYGMTGDMLRIGAQVVSGIGFLGAGSIIVTKQNRIRGLTTAAGLWASACMGLAIGIGFYECALIMMGAMLIVLVILSGFDVKYVKSPALISLFVEADPDFHFSAILQEIKDQGWNVQEIRELDFLGNNLLSLRVDLLSDEQVSKPHLDISQLQRHDKIHYINIL
ncbi:MAG: MgtC/SapB family protein [Firmicutes bacterium]|nr:MgtC/SapB family protein [Bacillota bacterium]